MVTSKVLDRGIVELLGPFGLSKSFYGGGSKMSKLDTGIITHYSLYIVIGLVLIGLMLSTPMVLGTIRDVRLVILFLRAFFVPHLLQKTE